MGTTLGQISGAGKMTGADNSDSLFKPSPAFERLRKSFEKKLKRKYINTLELNWIDFEKLAIELAIQIKEAKFVKISNIYGVPRGGLVLAARLSHFLDKPLITNWEDRTPDTLIVDDIADTGKTLSNLCSIHDWKTATLFFCPNSCFHPRFSVAIKSKGTWVEFPWEKKY